MEYDPTANESIFDPDRWENEGGPAYEKDETPVLTPRLDPLEMVEWLERMNEDPSFEE